VLATPRTHTFTQRKQCKKIPLFGIRNKRGLHRAGSITAADREFTIFKLDLVGVHFIRKVKVGTLRAEDYTFSITRT
jgi:hypothetical protein